MIESVNRSSSKGPKKGWGSTKSAQHLLYRRYWNCEGPSVSQCRQVPLRLKSERLVWSNQNGNSKQDAHWEGRGLLDAFVFLHSLRLEPQLKKTFPDRIGATSIDTEEGIGVTDQRRLNASSFSTPHEPDLHRAFTLSGQAWGFSTLLGFNPSVFASSTERKLWVGPLFTMARVFFPLIYTSTCMSPFLTDLGFDLAMALINCLYPHVTPPHKHTTEYHEYTNERGSTSRNQ